MEEGPLRVLQESDSREVLSLINKQDLPPHAVTGALPTGSGLQLSNLQDLDKGTSDSPAHLLALPGTPVSARSFLSQSKEETTVQGGRQAEPEVSPAEAVPAQQTTFIRVKGVGPTGPKCKILALWEALRELQPIWQRRKSGFGEEQTGTSM